MNKNDQITGLFFLVITAILIGITFFLFLLQKASAPVIPENIPTTPLASTTQETIAHSVVVETPVSTSSVVERTLMLPEGIKHEIRNEVLVKTWRHSNGTNLALYEKDYFYVDWSPEPTKQIAFRTTSADGTVVELYTNIPDAGPISRRVIGEVVFSPLGAYVTIELERYESRENLTFDLRDGRQVRPIEGDYNSGYDLPYWNADESKLVVVRSASPIDGTVAQLTYSDTGSFEDLKLITPTTETYRENFIYNVVVEGNGLTASTKSNEWESSEEGTLVLDMNTGAFTTTPTIEW